MQLAIDTSTETAGLALVQDSEVLAELTWHCRQSHSTELLPRLLDLLNQSRLSIQSISGIVIARGPGSFNGLRVGVSIAKGLSLSLGCPIVGISTLEAAAYPYADIGFPVCPLLNAGRGEIAAAIYHKKQGAWGRLLAEHITTADALCSQITTRTIFCGEFTPDIAALLRTRLRQKAIIMSVTARLRRAGFLAELGLKRLENGDFDNPAALQPLYLRRPSITEPKRR